MLGDTGLMAGSNLEALKPGALKPGQVLKVINSKIGGGIIRCQDYNKHLPETLFSI